MRLFIAEKPSVAKAIATELGITQRAEGYIECGETTVTWCFGHMLEQAEPDEYTPDTVPVGKNGRKLWRVEELPIIPQKWIVKPKDDAKKQLKVIEKLLKGSSSVVNAGDPDREGCLLVDEVLEYFHYKNDVYRFWVSAQDSVSVRRGLDAIKNNSDYQGWSDAARARQRADWLIGMNLSRAYTLRAKRGGSQALLTIGRVQTPTLALIVKRDQDIENFSPIPYHTIKAEIQHENGNFVATWKAKEDQQGLDPEGRLIDTAIADDIVKKVTNQSGELSEYKQEAKKQAQPLSFSLSDITALASAKYGYSAEDVLNICQSLYETHKLTTYPRTDCPYLPESQHDDARSVLDAICYVNPELTAVIDVCDIQIKSPTWNDKKITAHHGIIPTMHNGKIIDLNEKERKIYDLIVRAYIAQFYPVHEYMQTTVTVDIKGETFGATGKVVKVNGWRELYTNEQTEKNPDADDENQNLPSMTKGDLVHCLSAVRKDAKTKPPSRFTEGTVIRAMENIHKYVENPEHKKLLKDGDGVGTSATRASIISELKRHEFLETKGKTIVSTALGRSVIAALPEVVKSPVLTAIYERMLKGIEQGTAKFEDFVLKQEAFVREQVAKANDGSVVIAGGKESIPVSDIYKCQSCGAGLSRRPAKKKGQFWWGCSAYPNCKQTYFDVKGKPDYTKVTKEDK